jgi:enoyl-[acyl-carrier-protein] reductase (NADH)
MELSLDGIRSNVVAPGAIMTPLITKALSMPQDKGDELTRYIDERLGAKQATGRNGTGDDVANAALFLVSDLSAYSNGVVIPVVGGISTCTLSTSDGAASGSTMNLWRSADYADMLQTFRWILRWCQFGSKSQR